MKTLFLLKTISAKQEAMYFAIVYFEFLHLYIIYTSNIYKIITKINEIHSKVNKIHNQVNEGNNSKPTSAVL